MLSIPTRESQPVASVSSRSGDAVYMQELVLDNMDAVRGPATNNHYQITFAYGTVEAICDLQWMHAMQWWRCALDAQRWRQFVQDSDSSSDVDALTSTVEATLEFIATYGPRALDLRNLDSSEVQGEHLAALLRASSTWRNDVPGWVDAVDVAKEALRRAGVDEQDALFGMI